MNFLDQTIPQQREARLRYLDAEFQVVRGGDFVRCAVTGDPIRVDHLRYWSVDRQVPYKSADVAFGELLKSLR
ncbi:MAG TPA: DUF2093 domain-containing protein [Aestuariivirga sp.]|nr:DUF2093 domain-containing protein [Aestuariivirga sp.]